MERNTRSSIPRDPVRNAARQALRLRLLASRRQLPDDRRAAADESIRQRLRKIIESAAPAVLGIYLPVRGEPDLRPLVESMKACAMRLALPVVDGPDRPLRFVEWVPGEPTVPGAYGIPRPARDVAVSPDTLVIPCVGFDARCYRLGYGGGFYDRTLAALAAGGGAPPTAIGVGYDESEVADIEPDRYDVALAAIVTPTRVLTAGSAPDGSTR